jgi:hypothetical protein
LLNLQTLGPFLALDLEVLPPLVVAVAVVAIELLLPSFNALGGRPFLQYVHTQYKEYRQHFGEVRSYQYT